MEERIQKLEKELILIKERNLKVEADKAWETSYFRVLLITVIIYIVAAKLLYSTKVDNYLLGAIIPAVGYFLSVQSLPFVKKWWIQKHNGKS